MGIQDRRYNRSGGSDQGGGGMFSGGEGFFGWSFPLFQVPRGFPGIGGIAVRVHILYLILAGTRLLQASGPNGIGLGYEAVSLATLFVLVLLHEFGHCVACRMVGGQADRVLMWPLGGLASCIPPRRWLPSLITTLGGPGVNLVLLPVFGFALLATGAEWRHVVFNPFRPAMLHGSVWQLWLWWAHYMNFLLLAFNMLAPMFPMDCGRVVQELLWSKLGYRRSMMIAVNLGMVVAVLMGVLAVTSGASSMLGIAIFGGITCYSEKQRLKMEPELEPWQTSDDDEPQSKPGWFARRAEERARRDAQKRREEEANRQSEIDRILAKIRQSGMGSLTAKEQAALKEETERTRGR